MTVQPTIDLVLPVLNPSQTWVGDTLARKLELERQSGRSVRLIVVNDGAKDHGPFVRLEADDPSMAVIHFSQNKGKGAALRAGISSAASDLILFTDADFPYTIDSMVAVIKALEKGVDIALGYREQDYYASVPWFRKGMSESFRFLLKRVLRFPITDTQCGLKGMNKKGVEVFLSTRIDRFLVDMEFIKLAVRSEDLKIEPVVVKLRNDVTFSKMGVKVILREGLNFLRVFFS